MLSPGCNLHGVVDCDAGYVVEATADAFAEKLGLLLREGTLRDEMGLRGQLLVEESYSWHGIAERLEGVYESLL